MVVYLLELFSRLIRGKWQIGMGGNRSVRIGLLGGGHPDSGRGVGAYGLSVQGEGHGGMLTPTGRERGELRKR